MYFNKKNPKNYLNTQAHLGYNKNCVFFRTTLVKNFDRRFSMSKFSFTVFLLGLTLFFLDFSYGLGWLLGWVFIGLLEDNREKLLNRILNNNFSVGKYVSYLLGVIVWIATPLLISFFLPEYINPVTIFAAYFINRIIMFVTKTFVKEER